MIPVDTGRELQILRTMMRPITTGCVVTMYLTTWLA